METRRNDIVNVLIVDDHRLYSDGLNTMLGPESGIKVLGQVYDSREVREKIAECAPHVVLMDYNMPYINGMELTKLLLAEKPELKILILSIHNEERLIESFRSVGAKGYLFKTASAHEVVLATRKVYAGEYYFPGTGTADTNTNEGLLKELKLSARETEIIQLMKAGLKTREIAKKLKVSDYTVEMCRKNIKLKAAVKGEADFVRFINQL